MKELRGKADTKKVSQLVKGRIKRCPRDEAAFSKVLVCTITFNRDERIKSF